MGGEPGCVLSMGVACFPGRGSKDHEAGRTREGGAGARASLSGRRTSSAPSPGQEPVTHPPHPLAMLLPSFSPSTLQALLPSPMSY